jgi:hypothetical protein
MVNYVNPVSVGLDAVTALGDGYTINLKWFQAYPDIDGYQIAYHIYYSTIKENIYEEGVKYISLDGSLEANIIDLVPGQLYFFTVRPVEYNPNLINIINILPVAYDNLRVYPYSLLRQDITATDLLIPLVDVDGFPSSGIIKIGVELIQYLAVDTVNKNLVLTNEDQRGFLNTNARIHTVGGYDGYYTWNPNVTFFTPYESNLYDRIFMGQCRFEYPNYQSTLLDGYHQVTKDILSTDLTASDDFNVNFPSYDYSGYHRTDPVLLLTGACVGSYIGGEMGCIDGYGNVNMLRGLSVQDHNNQRQEVLLEVTGRPVVLIQRMRTGITCSCYRPSSEYQDDRCPFCFGTKFVFGYQQYFNPRRSDGRILMRPGPTEENLKMYEAGLESEFPLDLWTLTVPTIKTRDVLVMFDMDDNEEFRYEVMGVTRHNTLVELQGGQKLRASRIRKTDPAYQIRVFRNTAMFPSKMNTTIGMTTGIAPHTHQIVVSEKITSLNQINQTTAVSQGHNHPIVNGVVMEALGHTHEIIL